MQVDESKDRVFIYDLDKELEDLDSEGGDLVFLPDIERKMTKIPQSLLKSTVDPTNQELVVYNIPSSLTVPEEEDKVRKAIVEARARAREAQLHVKIPEQEGRVIIEQDEDFGDTPIVEEIDEDAMDIT